MAMYVPDNYDAYDRYEAEQEMRLSRSPKCAECGEPIQDEHLYVIDEELFCESCMYDLFRRSTEDYEE